MTMIALTMTLEEKQAIARQAARKLRNLYRSAVIAGGYPRDIILGAKPKDIDIFIDSAHFPNQERRDSAADAIFAAFGQTWTRDAAEAGLEPQAYGELPAGQLDEGVFQVYYSITNDGEWENLNLIFSRNNERVIHFDWSICRAYLYEDGIEFGRQAMDLSNIQLMSTENMPLVIKHAKRIKEKYPTAVFKIPTQMVNNPNTYLQLLQGGIIDGPREILQAQGQDGRGNEVRQHVGAGDRQQVTFTPEQYAEWAFRNPHLIAARAFNRDRGRTGNPVAHAHQVQEVARQVFHWDDEQPVGAGAGIAGAIYLETLAATAVPTTPNEGRIATARTRAQRALDALRGNVPRI